MRIDPRIQDLIRIVCTIAAIAMVLVSFIVYHASLYNLLIFLAFVLFYMQIPGLLVTGAIGLQTHHASERILLSFFTGWIFVVLQYFITVLIGTKILLYLIGPLCSLYYLWLVFIKRTLSPAAAGVVSLRKISPFMYMTAAVLMAYVFLNTQYQYLSPALSKCVYVSIDKAYQMGLIGSLSRGFPLQSPWVDGVVEYYHVFTQIMLSVPVALFDISPDFLVMSCCPYLTVCLVSLGLYSMFIRFTKYSSRAGLYTLSVLLSNMFIARSFTSSYIFRILLINDNHGGFAVSCLASCVILLDICCRDKRSDRQSFPQLILLFALSMLLTGIKAPLGLVFTGAVLGTTLLGALLRGFDLKKMSAVTSASILGFAFAYIILLAGDPTPGAAEESVFHFGSMTNLCFWKDPFIAAMRSIGIPSPVRLIAILTVFAITFFTIYTLPLAVGYLRELVLVIGKKKDYDFARVTVYAAFLIGFVMMMFLRYSGHSQVYFGTASTLFAPLIAFWFLESRPEITSRPVKILWTASRAWLLVLIIFTSVSLFADMRSMLPEAIAHADPETQYNPYRSLSSDEYDAMMWIRTNTPEDSLLATQMYASEGEKYYDPADRWSNCHFVYASYSGRRFYLEGSGFTLEDYETETLLRMIRNTDMLYDPDNSRRGDLARSLGIDYVVFTKKIYPATDLSSDDYSLVYSNKDIDIYQVTAG